MRVLDIAVLSKKAILSFLSHTQTFLSSLISLNLSSEHQAISDPLVLLVLLGVFITHSGKMMPSAGNKRQTRQFLLKNGMTNLHQRNQNLSTFIEFYFERQILALIIVLAMRGDLATEGHGRH